VSRTAGGKMTRTAGGKVTRTAGGKVTRTKEDMVISVNSITKQNPMSK
jgi:exosome complex RNA-binding protein Csl4